MATSIEHVFDGVARVTLPLPTAPGHVHCYLLEGDDGWSVVDTGLGLPDAAERWRALLGEAGAAVARVVVTHFHPDHLGAARDLAELTGAPVLQSEADLEQTSRVWASPDWPERLAEWFERHGMPPESARTVVDQGRLYAPFIRYADSAEPLGDEVGGWRVVATPGHADGHVCLLRDGVLVAGDHLLAAISPAIGFYPDGAPDPLGRTSPRWRSSNGSRHASRCPATGPRLRIRRGVRASSGRTTPTASTRAPPCWRSGRARPTRSRSSCSPANWTTARGASRWPRRSRTSSGSWPAGGPGGPWTAGRRPILGRSIGRRPPSQSPRPGRRGA